MSESIRCPDCGRENPAGSVSCEGCNYPLSHAGAPASTSAAKGADSARGRSQADASPGGGREKPEASPVIPRMRPIRTRRPRPPQPIALQLWLMFAIFAAAAVIYIAVRANVDRAKQPIEGTNENQQKRAEDFQTALAKDSTSVEAHIGLANVFYDTGNWAEAIVHYRAAVNRDSSRVTALVDMGVCYYNLSDAAHAEQLFLLGLKRDPHQPVALFNLGIVNEARGNAMDAMRYFHQALESNPPEEMKKAVMEAMTRIGKATGLKAPPLPQSTTP